MWTLLLALAFAGDRGARADDAASPDAYVPPPKERLWYTNSTFLRLNPLGLIEAGRVGWRHRLSTKDSLLWRDTYTWVAASAVVTPAWVRVGGYVEAQPIALLRVFAEVDGVQYFGSFDQVLSWSDPGVRFSDQTLATLGEAGENAPRGGWVATFGGTLQVKAGPVAIRSTAQLLRFDLALPDGHVVFYDQFWDRLAPNKGFMVLNDLDVLGLFGDVRVGARYTFSDGLDGQGRANDGALSQHRVGPMVAVQLKNDPPGARFNQPTVFVLAQWWVQHPYRTGEEQPAGLPLIAAGFAFNGDLLKGK